MINTIRVLKDRISNEGTLEGGCKRPGAIHRAPYDEIYYALKGEAILHMSGDDYDISAGTIVFIPGGTFHALENKSDKEDFVLLTIWPLHPELRFSLLGIASGCFLYRKDLIL